jgi:hypothetical protein
VKWFTLLAGSSSRDFRNAAIANDALENFGPHRCSLQSVVTPFFLIVTKRTLWRAKTARRGGRILFWPRSTGLVVALEEFFGRIQIFSDELTLARYRQNA